MDRQKSHINIARQHTDATRDKSAVLQSAPTAPRPIAQCVCVRACVCVCVCARVCVTYIVYRAVLAWSRVLRC